MEERVKKIDELRSLGFEPFGHRVEKDEISNIVKKFDELKPGSRTDTNVKVAGRVMSIRTHGKVTFSDIIDFSGKIQIYLNEETLKKDYNNFLKLVDTGDILEVYGKIFRTKKGELSVWVEKFSVLTKSIRPLPHTWYGLKDIETRYRQRYLDLILNNDVKKTFVLRTKVIDAIREFLKRRGFFEVDTPTLQSIPGGAEARPFITHHNVLGIDLYLRISPELYLKRLIVGGFEKVFEFSRNFRNEGIDRSHNPEFTMLEWYWAYADYKDNIKLAEEMLKHVVKNVIKKPHVEYQGKKIDFSKKFEVISMLDAIKKHCGIDVAHMSDSEIISFALKHNIELKEETKGEAVAAIFDELVEPKLINPTFITDYPAEISPLAKKKKGSEWLTERFELIIAGMEIANGYTELNDPLDQYQRFVDQMKKREKGDEEAHRMDKDFVRALEFGMPPTTGIGIGIDRFVMILTNSACIRDVILFPTLRPEHVSTFFDLEA